MIHSRTFNLNYLIDISVHDLEPIDEIEWRDAVPSKRRWWGGRTKENPAGYYRKPGILSAGGFLATEEKAKGIHYNDGPVVVDEEERKIYEPACVIFYFIENKRFIIRSGSLALAIKSRDKVLEMKLRGEQFWTEEW